MAVYLQLNQSITEVINWYGWGEAMCDPLLKLQDEGNDYIAWGNFVEVVPGGG